MTILNIIYLGFLVFFLACVAQGDVAKERSRRVTITVMDAKCRKFQDFKIERYELDGKMCLYWSKGAKNFTDAKKDCEAQGARLGVFKGAEKMQILIRQNVIWKRNFWIGLDDLVTEGTLVWHDGTILPRSDYYPLYFNAYNPTGGTQRCVQFWSYDRKLDDVECYSIIYYVCEKLL